MTAVTVLQKTSVDAPFTQAVINRRELRDDDIFIDIQAAGICHSDIHTIRNEWGEAHFPLTVGHEIAGIVTQVGDKVTKYRVGDRVGVGCLVNSCRECQPCREDEEQNCERHKVGTYNSRDIDDTITQGGYATGIVVPEHFACRIPDSLSFEHAAPLLCAGITTYQPLKRWVKAGDKVAVLGLGGLGHMGVQIAAALGADVTVLSRTTAKADLAQELGARQLLATSEEDFFDRHRGEFDVILNTISADIDVDRYLSLLTRHGVMAVVGLPPEAQPLHFGALIGGAKVLTGSNIGGIKQTQEMLDFCAEHGIYARTELINPDQVDETYDRVVAGDVHFRAVIDTTKLPRPE
ncbi:NAD(P)-dependent alcohol dehydrogenase [Corynebacterium aquilae]|uniref:alcohol dehydrogenase (NADP(+)) n=1 Tax=Corynebacterium aquilae DSM 44791 TaxID=1431546 RepID=A0A1L7CFF3_9CORY|nr:NAD(P)-dependent alcohol dehydrogenase [Corynebacterium aquilae]APT84591.1 alcohol dehydrogenase [Corynebacterium aquilae DSM 44791]